MTTDRTFDRGLADEYGNPLPDDPAAWTDDELSAALYDRSLRAAVCRLTDAARRRRVALSEREACAAVLRADDGPDWLARRNVWTHGSCVACRAAEFAPPHLAERARGMCTTCIPF